MMLHQEVAPGRHVYTREETQGTKRTYRDRTVKLPLLDYLREPRSVAEIATHFSVSEACAYKQASNLVAKGEAEFTARTKGTIRKYRSKQ